MKTNNFDNANVIKSPFPYFGGKSKVAATIWARFGEVRNYVEPFFGSGAVLLGRPLPFAGSETVNDADGMVSNFWRALQSDPDGVAHHADWPVNENDLHARHAWLVGQRDDITRRLEGDPGFCDVKAAGWWVWGICCWIGRNWCSGRGPWQVVDIDGVHQLIKAGNAGRGVNRQLVHLGNAGRGVNRQLVHLGDAGQGLREWMAALAERLRRVRVCCGDWSRVCTPAVTTNHGLTAVFLDPPYADTAERCKDVYAKDSLSAAHDVRDWAIAHGSDPLLRICLAGYEGEHDMPADWECVAWKAKGGYGNQKKDPAKATGNRFRERLWFSPHCLKIITEKSTVVVKNYWYQRRLF